MLSFPLQMSASSSAESLERCQEVPVHCALNKRTIKQIESSFSLRNYCEDVELDCKLDCKTFEVHLDVFEWKELSELMQLQPGATGGCGRSTEAPGAALRDALGGSATLPKGAGTFTLFFTHLII